MPCLSCCHFTLGLRPVSQRLHWPGQSERQDMLSYPQRLHHTMWLRWRQRKVPRIDHSWLDIQVQPLQTVPDGGRETHLAACYLPQSLQMQRKLCRLRLQQMRLWLLWQELHAEEKFNTKKFSKPDSRGERSIHEIRQHVQALCKWLYGYVYSLRGDKHNPYGGWRPNVPFW